MTATEREKLNTEILRMAGYQCDEARHVSAVDYALDTAAKFAGLNFGTQAIDVVLRVRLTARNYFLSLPNSASNVVIKIISLRDRCACGVNEGQTLPSGSIGVFAGSAERLDGCAFGPGVYEISCKQQPIFITPGITKALSLLAAYYADLSDPEQSRWLNLTQGDWSGTMRFSELPVPEAQQLLESYRSGLAVVG